MSTTAIPFQDRAATLRVRPSLPDHRDAWLFASVSAAALPPKADLGVTVPVKDQGRQGSCTGHGYSSMVEALEAIRGRPHADLSRAFIYAEERIAERDLDRDAGAMPLDGCKVLKKLGVCREAAMPYRDTVFDVAPPPPALAEAKAHRIARYARLAGSLAVKQATANRTPVGFGLAVYESFERIGPDGLMPMPKPGEAMLGGHWVFGNALGYEDDPGLPGGGGFWVQNSWGTGFAKGGYLLMPYAYVDNPAYTFECRAIFG